jgi:hypothetical protein
VPTGSTEVPVGGRAMHAPEVMKGLVACCIPKEERSR